MWKGQVDVRINQSHHEKDPIVELNIPPSTGGAPAVPQTCRTGLGLAAYLHYPSYKSEDESLSETSPCNEGAHFL